MPAYYVRAAFRSTNATTGALVVNVVSLEADVLTDPPNYTTMATDVDSWLRTTYLNMLSALETLHDVTVTQHEQGTVAPGQGIANVNLPGNRASSTTNLDPAICAVIQLKTATPKRYARGRLFAPPAHDAGQVANGAQWAPAGTYWTALQAFSVALQNGHAGSGVSYKPIVYSRTQYKKGLTPYQFPVIQVIPANTQHWLTKRHTSP